jgi:ATP-dependent helicase HrpB
VVLATSIAETSLTIEGVRVVVDAGLMRVPRFSPRHGLTRLETTRVTRSSADQRRGRAGRVAPGVCYRLWSEVEEQQLAPRGRPEILEADLAPLALELAEAGVQDPMTLRWLDPPPGPALAQARELLTQLNGIDATGRVTDHGRRMARVPVHPRLAHMLLRGADLGCGRLACQVAALVSERDVLRFEAGGPIDADLRLRVDTLQDLARGRPAWGTLAHGAAVDRGALHRALAISRDLARHLPSGARDGIDDSGQSGVLLAFAYPDRIAQRRASDSAGSLTGRVLLRNGAAAAFVGAQPLAAEPYVVVADLGGGRQTDPRIHLAAPLTLDEIETHFADQIDREEVVWWDGDAGIVRSQERHRLGALVLRERTLGASDPTTVARVLLAAVADTTLRELRWSEAARELRERMTFMHHVDPGWPDVSDAALTATLDEWLAPHVYGITRRDELRRLDLAGILAGLMTWQQRTALDDLAPSHISVPSGSRIRVDYSNPAAPVLAVRLQELFGWSDTPRVAGGRVPLTLHLLSPAHRPVQVTADLAGFWRAGYFDVRKELKGRYPKHYWPDDPLAATATRHTRPR